MAKAEVLPFEAEDIEIVLPAVRQADIDEIEEALGIEMREALADCQSGSCKASKIVVDGEIVAVFGDAVYSLLGSVGVPWLISTSHVEKHPKAFLKVCKPEVADMLTRHSHLINYVDVRNTRAIRWLEWLGFQMGDPEPYGFKRYPFRKFTMSREA